MTWAISEKGYSQRRACRLVGLQPKTYRYASTRPDDGALRTRLKELASQRPLRLPSPGAAIGSARGPDQSEEAVAALQGGAADRAQAWWP